MSVHLRSIVSASLVLASIAAGGAALAMPSRLHDARSLASLTDAQRATLDAAAQQEHASRAQLRAAIAAQVERGQIDRGALAPQVLAEKQTEANVTRVVDETLTAEQKAQLAGEREAHREAHRGHGKRHGDGGGDAKKGEGARAHGAKLNLTAEQRQQIRARMAAEPKGDRGVDKMVDRFDAMAPVLTPAQRAEVAAKLRK